MSVRKRWRGLSENDGQECLSSRPDLTTRRLAMTRNVKNLFIPCVAMILALAAAGNGPCLAAGPATLSIGVAAPDFNLPGVDGKNHTLDEYRNADVWQSSSRAIIVRRPRLMKIASSSWRPTTNRKVSPWWPSRPMIPRRSGSTNLATPT